MANKTYTYYFYDQTDAFYRVEWQENTCVKAEKLEKDGRFSEAPLYTIIDNAVLIAEKDFPKTK